MLWPLIAATLLVAAPAAVTATHVAHGACARRATRAAARQASMDAARDALHAIFDPPPPPQGTAAPGGTGDAVDAGADPWEDPARHALLDTHPVGALRWTTHPLLARSGYGLRLRVPADHPVTLTNRLTDAGEVKVVDDQRDTYWLPLTALTATPPVPATIPIPLPAGAQL